MPERNEISVRVTVPRPMMVVRRKKETSRRRARAGTKERVVRLEGTLAPALAYFGVSNLEGSTWTE